MIAASVDRDHQQVLLQNTSAAASVSKKLTCRAPFFHRCINYTRLRSSIISQICMKEAVHIKDVGHREPISFQSALPNVEKTNETIDDTIVQPLCGPCSQKIIAGRCKGRNYSAVLLNKITLVA